MTLPGYEHFVGSKIDDGVDRILISHFARHMNFLIRKARDHKNMMVNSED